MLIFSSPVAPATDKSITPQQSGNGLDGKATFRGLMLKI